MPYRTHSLFRFAALLVVTLTSACASGVDSSPPTAQAAFLGVEIERGLVIAQRECASCHAIGPTGDSPTPMSPPFRALASDFSGPTLEARLLVISDLGHQEMRPAGLDAAEVRDLAAYIETLD